jgi:quinol-cytochrome oxidoreductase complex cytochrome b subunit
MRLQYGKKKNGFRKIFKYLFCLILMHWQSLRKQKTKQKTSKQNKKQNKTNTKHTSLHPTLIM